MNNFREQLKESNNQEDFWDAVYRQAFPALVNHMPGPGKTESQDKGIDRILLLSSGQILLIEEKMRFGVYPDILLEFTANDRTNAPGWMEKELIVDYLAYAFLPTRTCHLFDWPSLQRAWHRHKAQWKKEYGIRTAENPTYNTLGVPVPVREIERAVWAGQTITLKQKEESLRARAIHDTIDMFDGVLV